MNPTGKNLCINKKGIISLIDFGIALLQNSPKSLLLKKKKKIKCLKKNQFYEIQKTQLEKILYRYENMYSHK